MSQPDLPPALRAMRRLRLRTLMIIVAIVGLIFGAVVGRQRWLFNRSMASYHANEERRMRLLLIGGWITEKDKAGARKKIRIGRNIDREEVQQRLRYHILMADRHQRAASYPWLPVAPGSP
jgi:hypothetical protein